MAVMESRRAPDHRVSYLREYTRQDSSQVLDMPVFELDTNVMRQPNSAKNAQGCFV